MNAYPFDNTGEGTAAPEKHLHALLESEIDDLKALLASLHDSPKSPAVIQALDLAGRQLARAVARLDALPSAGR